MQPAARHTSPGRRKPRQRAPHKRSCRRAGSGRPCQKRRRWREPGRSRPAGLRKESAPPRCSVAILWSAAGANGRQSLLLAGRRLWRPAFLSACAPATSPALEPFMALGAARLALKSSPSMGGDTCSSDSGIARGVPSKEDRVERTSTWARAGSGSVKAAASQRHSQERSQACIAMYRDQCLQVPWQRSAPGSTHPRRSKFDIRVGIGEVRPVVGGVCRGYSHAGGKARWEHHAAVA
jgi:hypothetical protein